MGSHWNQRSHKHARKTNSNVTSRATESTSHPPPRNPDGIVAMNAHQNLGTLSNLPSEVREQIWFYALEACPPTEYPVETFLTQSFVSHNTAIREEAVSVFRCHDLAFRLLDVQKPSDLSPHIAMLPNLQSYLTKQQQNHSRYGFPIHIRLHIRISRQSLYSGIEAPSDLQDELTAW
jgi:hypothetical protein